MHTHLVLFTKIISIPIINSKKYIYFSSQKLQCTFTLIDPRIGILCACVHFPWSSHMRFADIQSCLFVRELPHMSIRNFYYVQLMPETQNAYSCCIMYLQLCQFNECMYIAKPTCQPKPLTCLPVMTGSKSPKKLKNQYSMNNFYRDVCWLKLSKTKYLLSCKESGHLKFRRLLIGFLQSQGNNGES